MKRKLLARNTVTSVIYQMFSVLCGFVLPRMILSAFGSQTNGLVSSITQFIQVINLFDLGITSVIVYNLYKPLALHDNQKLSEVVSSADSFFKKIGIALIGYVIVLAIAYPVFIDSGFDYTFVVFLVLIMGINAFGQYYFGVVNRLILIADQNNYIPYITQTLTVVCNTVLCYVVIKLGGSIHAVKFITSIIYLVRPIIYALCVKKKYSINRQMITDGKVLDQKWNGIAQHISSVILDSTDTIVLTLFSTLTNVSIYNIYFLVITGIKGFITSLTGGVNSLLGNLWAENRKESFVKTFQMFEWGMSMITVICFGCVGVMLVPFVSIYTKDINDANYIQPVFAVFICLAYSLYSLRVPYSSVVLQIGHYKQTQISYVISVIINLGVSILCVNKLGLVGVAVGTFVALLYHTLYFQYYVYKKVLKLKVKRVFKLYFVMALSIVSGYIVHLFYTPTSSNIIEFILSCIAEGIIWTVVALILNSIFYKKNVLSIYSKLGVLL
ncbi:MAG: sugar isomerase [Dorea sp.]|uniref:lipopolysaccharide biosynthesis protein n=1 Tax=Sporofaciens sp. JLR.KK001 TaxID=3112621 RepID=UPI0021710F30|nr:sugar isomerase [Dorea sp.]